MNVYRTLVLVMLCVASPAVFSQEITVDCSRTNGEFRALHGVNGGILSEGSTVDLTPFWQEAKIPSTRLHDCQWPAPAVVDMHALFPDFRNDPKQPENYRFGPTDDYLKPIVQNSTQIIYRLGESIEHTERKHFVNPPPNAEKWAEIALHVVKHYNDGWADGFRYNIQYWEIWNEPENQPAMWTGTDDEFFNLYQTTAKKIKRHYPHLKIGGPSVGGGFEIAENGWQVSPYVVSFLRFVKANEVPLDFFSWHTYTDEPRELVEKNRVIRKYLDDNGFTSTEIHLNEWNYLPDKDWGPMLRKHNGKEREKWYQQMGGSEGAAFLLAVLLEMQNEKVDVCNFYKGDTGGFGLFTVDGTPKKNFFAMKAFRQLLATPLKFKTDGMVPNQCTVAVGTNSERNAITVLVANLRNDTEKNTIRFHGLSGWRHAKYELYLLDDRHDLEVVETGNVDIAEGKFEWHFTHPQSSVLLISVTELDRP